MPQSIPLLTGLLAALCLLPGCSKMSGSAPSGTAASGGAASPPGVTQGSACEQKLLTVDDVSGILGDPITGTAPLKGDPQTCYFVTATTESKGGPEIMISVRRGLGKVTLQALKSGAMNVSAAPVSGVGDDAAWVAELKELDAQKGDLLCVAAVSGSGVIEHQDDLQNKLGALCNKVFARAG